MKQGATKKIAHRWLVKIDASTGETIWEIIMPSNNSKIGTVAGQDSTDAKLFELELNSVSFGEPCYRL